MSKTSFAITIELDDGMTKNSPSSRRSCVGSTILMIALAGASVSNKAPSNPEDPADFCAWSSPICLSGVHDMPNVFAFHSLNVAARNNLTSSPL